MVQDLAITEKCYNFAGMNELSRHIEVLLLSNDCVVVPGLGGFVAHHVCARYDESEGLFLPPSRTLGFNPQLTMNDSLLVQSYAETYDMSYPEALRRVESDVDDLKKQLSERGEYSMHGVGTLAVNSDKSLVFEPCSAGLLTPSLYALNYLEFPRMAANVADSAKVVADADVAKPKARIIYIDKEAGSGHAMLNVRVSALRQAAVAAMIALVFVLALNTDFNPTQQAEKYRSSVLSFLYSNKSSVLNTVVAQRPAPKATPKAAAKKAEKADAPYWTVVLCSHVSNKNAEWFKETLQKDGIQGTVLPGDNANAKVVYGRYPTKDEAQSALRSMSGKKHFEQGWIMLVEK